MMAGFVVMTHCPRAGVQDITALEYALVSLLVSIGIVAGAHAIGSGLNTTFTAIASSI